MATRGHRPDLKPPYQSEGAKSTPRGCQPSFLCIKKLLRSFKVGARTTRSSSGARPRRSLRFQSLWLSSVITRPHWCRQDRDLIPHHLRYAYEKEMKVEFEQQDEEVVLALIKKLSVIGGAVLVELQYYWGNLNYNSFNDDVQNWLYCLAKHNYKLGLTEAEYFRIGMTLYYDFMQRFKYPSGGVNDPDGLGEYFSPHQLSEAVPFNGFLAIKQLKCGTFVFDAVGVRYENDLAPRRRFCGPGHCCLLDK